MTRAGRRSVLLVVIAMLVGLTAFQPGALVMKAHAALPFVEPVS